MIRDAVRLAATEVPPPIRDLLSGEGYRDALFLRQVIESLVRRCQNVVVLGSDADAILA